MVKKYPFINYAFEWAGTFTAQKIILIASRNGLDATLHQLNSALLPNERHKTDTLLKWRFHKRENDLNNKESERLPHI